MKTRSITFLIVAILFAACEPKTKIEFDRYIFVNKNIEVCGVKNPMENVNWLKELHTTFTDMINSDKAYIRQFDEHSHTEYYSGMTRIYLFTNDSTNENLILIDRDQNYNTLYSCSGEILDGGRCTIKEIFGDTLPGKTETEKTPQYVNSPQYEPMKPFDASLLDKCTFVDIIAVYSRKATPDIEKTHKHPM